MKIKPILFRFWFLPGGEVEPVDKPVVDRLFLFYSVQNSLKLNNLYRCNTSQPVWTAAAISRKNSK